MPAPNTEANERGGWSTRARGSADDGTPSWQIPDDGQPVLVYEWLPEKTGTDSRK